MISHYTRLESMYIDASYAHVVDNRVLRVVAAVLVIVAAIVVAVVAVVVW